MARNKHFIVILHTIGWLAFILFPILFLTHPHEVKRMHHLGIFITGVIISNGILIGFFYANYSWLIPRYYFTRRYVLFFGIGLTVMIVFVLIMVSNPMFAPPPNHPPPPPGAKFLPPPPPAGEHIPMWPFSLANIFRFCVVFFVSLGLRITQRLRDTEQEKTSSNLQYLKAQVNPHFLFNTLNSIYSLAVTRSEQTPEAIAKLSSIMRYVTTGTGEDRVLLEKETEYLKDYIDLQKMRMTGNIDTRFEITGNLHNKKIAPLLLIPFIENCFKYGVSTEHDSFIHINIDVNEQGLRFTAVNKIVRRAAEHEKSGTGLINVKERLKIIYPGRHELKITPHENIYSVELLLILD